MAPGFCLGCKSRGRENKPEREQSRLWNVLDAPGGGELCSFGRNPGPDGRPPAGGSHQLPDNPFSTPITGEVAAKPRQRRLLMQSNGNWMS